MRETAWKIGLLVGIATGLVWSVAPSTEASRNSGGTYSLPSGNPVVTGTTITSTWANNTLTDIGTELTNSLDRNGRGAMQAPLQLSNGSAAAPSLTFGTDTDTGAYRVGANNGGLTAGGVKSFDWTASGVAVTGTQSVSGMLTCSAGLTVTGAASGAGVSSTGGSGNTNGVYGLGSGSGTGVFGQAANTSGAIGVYGAAAGASSIGVNGVGVGGGLGGRFLSSASNVAVLDVQGYVDLDSSSYPASTDSVKDKVTPWGVAKLAGHYNPRANTLLSGFNLTSVACAAGVVTVTIAQDFAAADYVVVVSLHGSGGNSRHVYWTLVTVGVFTITTRDAAHADIAACADVDNVSFIGFGVQ